VHTVKPCEDQNSIEQHRKKGEGEKKEKKGKEKHRSLFLTSLTWWEMVCYLKHSSRINKVPFRTKIENSQKKVEIDHRPISYHMEELLFFSLHQQNQITLQTSLY
jgi:hypothetical protein